ncbi:MAG: hypothetical protein U0230_27180 [Polyangiales bacterium]
MSARPRMRPRFEVELTVPTETIVKRMVSVMQEESCAIRGEVRPRGAELRLKTGQRHFWSPFLSIAFYDDEAEGKTYLVGRFAPHPDVWTFFLCLYGLYFMVGLFGAMYGVSQWIIKQPPWAFWSVPLCLGLFAFTYGAAFIGQGLGAEQMYLMRTFVDRCLEDEPTGDGGRPPSVRPPPPVLDAQG